MAIRAIDMQVMMPRMADLSMQHQAEKERPVLEQMQMTNQQNKQVAHNANMVTKSNKHEQMKNEADAKKKGKNSYTYHPSKSKKGQLKEDEDSSIEDYHLLDIKV